jgi:hypothetical protein
MIYWDVNKVKLNGHLSTSTFIRISLSAITTLKNRMDQDLLVGEMMAGSGSTDQDPGHPAITSHTYEMATRVLTPHIYATQHSWANRTLSCEEVLVCNDAPDHVISALKPHYAALDSEFFSGLVPGKCLTVGYACLTGGGCFFLSFTGVETARACLGTRIETNSIDTGVGTSRACLGTGIEETCLGTNLNDTGVGTARALGTGIEEACLGTNLNDTGIGTARALGTGIEEACLWTGIKTNSNDTGIGVGTARALGTGIEEACLGTGIEMNSKDTGIGTARACFGTGIEAKAIDRASPSR